MKLSKEECEFLEQFSENRGLIILRPPQDMIDRVRRDDMLQTLLAAGYVESPDGNIAYVLTPAGRAALAEAEGK